MITAVKSAAALALFALPHIVRADAEGTIMGPSAFLWPDDRAWSASADNTAPCGSVVGVSSRTDYPLGEKGSVALTIAEESWYIELNIAYGNNPTSNDDFTSLLSQDVTEVEPGHQCYSIPTISTVAAGSNATIQLKYTGDDTGANQTFYACADITFVEASSFTTTVPCFNVSVDETTATSTASSSSATATLTDSSSSSSSSSSGGDGLSAGAKAGIAIGCIVGASAIVGTGLYFGLRRRRAAPSNVDSEIMAGHAMKQTPSLRSGSTRN